MYKTVHYEVVSREINGKSYHKAGTIGYSTLKIPTEEMLAERIRKDHAEIFSCGGRHFTPDDIWVNITPLATR